MTIAIGDKLPQATLIATAGDKPAPVTLPDYVAGRKVVVFALPAAFSGTCTTAHVPSFMRNMDALKAKGVDEVICLTVNDYFCVKAWDESMGASAAGITMLADGMSEFTKAVGMNVTAPAVGFVDRSKRYSMLVEDGVVTQLNLEVVPGACEIAAAETMLDKM
ncbi:peroxiredoxin [Pseudooceanicola sp.]|uniref:peroxiredoxin n=1 Tax=Pseudooceanicola sp. TaxID=1914328 RepID=UPI00260DE779|nr:peroxiredoxin [Pseudooceanicola sp.]MDF1856150.1 peroxiredoxin [Pseudooceanicola sp.]